MLYNNNNNIYFILYSKEFRYMKEVNMIEEPINSVITVCINTELQDADSGQ